MQRISYDDPQAVRFRPARPNGAGVLLLGGSSGRIDEGRARVFAEHGVVAESVRWFGGPGQSAGPWEVPLEFFFDRVRDLARECSRVYVSGVSFGAEAALLVGAHLAEVAGVIAFAPTDVVWPGVTEQGRVTSHWTLGGEPLPWCGFDQSWQPDSDPPAYVDLYRRSRRVGTPADIPVERVGALILVAGGDDQVWPSVEMAEAIRARRTGATVVLTEPEAGHRTILPGEEVVQAGRAMRRGGHVAADRRLGRAAWAAICELIDL